MKLQNINDGWLLFYAMILCSLTVSDKSEPCPSVYLNSVMFHKHHQTSLKATANSTEETVGHPLSILFCLLGLTPFKKVDSLSLDSALLLFL